MLTCLYQLNAQQWQDLLALRTQCQLKDNGAPKLYTQALRTKRRLPAILLHYHQHTLTGFLSMHFFAENSCEISLMIAPIARQQGLARALLRASLPLLRHQKIDELIFSSALSFATHPLARHFKAQTQDFVMQKKLTPAVPPLIPKLVIRQAQAQDIQALCAIDHACFAETLAMDRRFKTLLADKNYLLFITEVQQKPMGKVHLYLEHDNLVTLSDMAILPGYQHQGFGEALLLHSLHQAYSRGFKYCDLEVASHNHAALALYKKAGFDVMHAFAYHTISLEDLSDLVN
ncbi:MAG TPA: hypothetical protein DEO98_01505 [Legionellales bacterium]|nr:hypothetical protein [Legionellales bacterium]|tara:strand:+ start:1943 stop:2809 length:867 start_codon:yes stop_codon:yes gene_type:complete